MRTTSSSPTRRATASASWTSTRRARRPSLPLGLSWLEDVELPGDHRPVHRERMGRRLESTGEQVDDEATPAGRGHDPVTRVAAVDGQAVDAGRAEVGPPIRRVLVQAGLQVPRIVAAGPDVAPEGH